MSKKDYTNWNKDELIAEIKHLKKRKKYGLVWEDKPEDVVEQCKKELPVLEEVKDKEIITDPDKPMNLLIEGDNYHALSVLNYTHKGKIDVIYIDPPYNTGNKDFIYNDNYVDREDAFRHSKWLSFIEKRLRLSKSLLKKTGLIFISIDDNEIANLKALCDGPNFFGEDNFVACLPTIMNLKGNNDQFGFAGTHEYTLVYAKDKRQTKINEFNVNEDEVSDLWDMDNYGFFKKGANLKSTGINAPRYKRPNLFFPIFLNKKTKEMYITDNDKPKNNKDIALLPITSGEEMSWRWSKHKVKNESYNIILVEKDEKYSIYKKQRPQLGDLPSKKPKTLFYKPEYSSGNGTAELKKIFEDKVFDNPKPLQLIKDFLYLATNKESIILDFMAGSGTTGIATLELNKEDKGNRRFILCTNNELNGVGAKLFSENPNIDRDSLGICNRVTYPRFKKIIFDKKELFGNLKYFKTTFVPAAPTDKNKITLTQKATEMLCIKEDTFEKVKSNEQYKIYRNNKKYTGIIFDQQAISAFKKEITPIDGKFSVYIFSLGDDTFDEEFSDLEKKVKLSPIPEAILRVYRRIFK